MNGPFSLMGGAALLLSGVVSTLGGVGLYEVASNVLAPTVGVVQIARLEVVDPTAAKGGVFYHPVAEGHYKGNEALAAWSAHVATNGPTIGTETLCAGGGIGKYTDLEHPIEWTLDYLVGDDGCSARLGAGPHILIVRVAPLEGGAIALARAEFTVKRAGR